MRRMHGYPAGPADDHCFVVPAHGESPHLDDCLASLAAQSLPTSVVVATSTPNAHIEAAAMRHGVPLRINPRREGIGADWNFALDCASARWVTIAHQDDVYLPDFARVTLDALARHPDAVLAFTGYGELEGSVPRPPGTLVRIKRLLLELGFLGTSTASTRFFKTNALRFGCAIPCPAVTLDAASGLRFRTDLQVDLDWAAWLALARSPGTFVYIRRELMRHRVHAASETTAAIHGWRRAAEDRAILGTLWPAAVADAIVASYALAYRSNRTRTEP